MKKILEYFCNKQFLIFIAVGGINTVSGTVISYIFSFFLNVNVAFVVGYLFGLSISYVLNSIYTFKEQFSKMRFVKFGISYVPNFILQNLVVFIAFNVLHLHELIAYVLAAVIAIPATFIIMKMFTFRGNSRSSD